MKILGSYLKDKVDQGKMLVIPYIMAGDHTDGLAGLAETIAFLEQHGASAIEIGIPFSDPVADGPVIEQAGIRALVKGTTLKKVIEVLQTIETTIPLVMMSYINPIYKYGIEKFVDDLKTTPVKGLILPDVPREHEAMLTPFLAPTDITLVPLVTLTSTLERQVELVTGAAGFIYAVTVNGVTGVGRTYADNLNAHLERLSELSDVPVLAGFGVSSLDQAKNFHQVVDGVIVGSYIVQALHDGRREEIAAFLAGVNQI